MGRFPGVMVFEAFLKACRQSNVFAVWKPDASDEVDVEHGVSGSVL